MKIIMKIIGSIANMPSRRLHLCGVTTCLALASLSATMLMRHETFWLDIVPLITRPAPEAVLTTEQVQAWQSIANQLPTRQQKISQQRDRHLVSLQQIGSWIHTADSDALEPELTRLVRRFADECGIQIEDIELDSRTPEPFEISASQPATDSGAGILVWKVLRVTGTGDYGSLCRFLHDCHQSIHVDCRRIRWERADNQSNTTSTPHGQHRIEIELAAPCREKEPSTAPEMA